MNMHKLSTPRLQMSETKK